MLTSLSLQGSAWASLLFCLLGEGRRGSWITQPGRQKAVDWIVTTFVLVWICECISAGTVSGLPPACGS